MIRGDHLDRAVRDPRKQGIAVSAAAQRRVHLEPPVLLQILVAKQQVVRGRLATHAQAPVLGATYQFDALTGRHMADMVLAAGLFRERDQQGAHEGRGEQDPIASNATPQGQQMNRRVDIILRRGARK